MILSQCAWQNKTPQALSYVKDSVLTPHITVDSLTMDNIEVIRLPLDNIPDQYFSSYSSILHEVCDEQHDHTHQLGHFFVFYQRIRNLLYNIEKFEARLNVIHNIDKKINQNMSYIT